MTGSIVYSLVSERYAGFNDNAALVPIQLGERGRVHNHNIYSNVYHVFWDRGWACWIHADDISTDPNDVARISLTK